MLQHNAKRFLEDLLVDLYRVEDHYGHNGETVADVELFLPQVVVKVLVEHRLQSILATEGFQDFYDLQHHEVICLYIGTLILLVVHLFDGFYQRFMVFEADEVVHQFGQFLVVMLYQKLLEFVKSILK